jgi:hypothetical protein
MILKNSSAVMCVFLKLFVRDFVKVDPTQSLCHRYEELKYYEATLLTMSK